MSIRHVVNSVYEKEFFLPAIQREFVWKREQIEKLFDSLMRNYPIGSFLFWDVGEEKIKEFEFYEFIRDYHERDQKRNPKANVTGKKKIVAVLDGQQRITSLYIALKGTYADKIPYKQWKNDDAFPNRKLYLNILSESDDFEKKYDFKFLTKEEASYEDKTTFWFDIEKIVEFEELQDVIMFLNKSGIENNFATNCMLTLWEKITRDKLINYYLETSQELDKVLNIFIRINSGGTQLSYSDLLLSIATAQWEETDAREEITNLVDDLNRIGDGFRFDKDVVLKSCLVLSNISEIGFKVDNFNSNNMKKIENTWSEIKLSLRLTVELITSFGYNNQTLTSSNALIPIAYFIMTKGSPENFVESSKYLKDRRLIKKWLQLAILKRVFGGVPDNVLKPMRNVIQTNSDYFPLSSIIERFRGANKTLVFTEDDIENLFEYKYGQRYTFTILSLLYPTLSQSYKFHVDHIHPRSLFKKRSLFERNIPDEQYEFYLEKHDYLPNLQLLEGIANEEKSNQELIQWLEAKHFNPEEKLRYMEQNYIPKDVDLEFENFKEFYQARKELMKIKIKEILSLEGLI